MFQALVKKLRAGFRGSKAIGLLSYSVAVGRAATSVASFIVTAIIGRLSSRDLAAFGIGSAINHFIFALATGNRAVQAMVARRMGASDQKGANAVLYNALFVSALLASVTIPIGFFGDSLAALLAKDVEIVRLAGEFLGFSIRALGVVALNLAFDGYWIGLGKARIYSQVSVFGVIFRVLSNWLLISGPGPIPSFGITGAGIAELLTQVFAFSIHVGFFIRQASLHTKPGRPNLRVIKTILKLSLPESFLIIIFGTAYAAFYRLVEAHGAASLAAVVAVFSIIGVVEVVPGAMSAAVGTLVGKSLGEEDIAEAVHWSRVAARLGLLVAVFFAIILIAQPTFIMALISGSPDVVAVGRPLLIAAAVALPFTVGSMILDGVLHSGGIVGSLTAVSALNHWLVLLPIAYIFGSFLPGGVIGTWSGYMALQAAQLLGFYLLYRFRNWQSVQI